VGTNNGVVVTAFRRFSLPSILEVFVGCLIFAYGYLPPARAQAPTYTYTYAGNPMASTSPSPSESCTGCSVTGSFTTSQPLSANLVQFYGGVLPWPVPIPFLVSYSFAAGPFTFTGNNLNSAPYLEVSTDSKGAITGWIIEVSDDTSTIFTASNYGFNGTYDSVVYGRLVGSVIGSGNVLSAGTWVDKTTGDIRAATVPFTNAQSVGSVTINWREPFPDANYTAVCTVETTPSDFLLPVITARSPGSLTVNPTDGGSSGGILDCIAIPDSDVSHVRHARQTFAGFPPTLTASWSSAFPDPLHPAPDYNPSAVTPVCTVETQDNTAPGFTSVINAISSTSISVTNGGFADGTIHCLEVPDYDQSLLRGTRTPVDGNSTLPITWSVPFPDANYASACSDEVLGASGFDSAIAIYAGSKESGSMIVIPEISVGTVNCIALPSLALSAQIIPGHLPPGIWQTLPPVVVQQSYGPAMLSAVGGTPPYTWSTTGLPDGLSLDASSGKISGTFAKDAESSCAAENGCKFDPIGRQFQIAVSITDSAGSSAGPVWLSISLTCGGDGSRDGLIQQYTNPSAIFSGVNGITDVVTGKQFVPRCMDLTESTHSSKYTFVQLNSSNRSQSNVSLLATSLLSGQGVFCYHYPGLSCGCGLDTWVNDYGVAIPELGAPNGNGGTLGSGFRPPIDQARVYLNMTPPRTPRARSRHMFGDAVDLPVSTTQWKALLNAAINAGADFTETDTKSINAGLACSPAVKACVHADWRFATSPSMSSPSSKYEPTGSATYAQ
jgi:hypothetical protein